MISFDLPTQRMDLSKIISVAGKPGLFRVVAQGRNALIVESLVDGKRTPVPMSVRVSSLDEISMFTTGDDVPLKEVIAKLYEHTKGGASADAKGEIASLWETLLAVLPTADRERIYESDVRKLFTWYALLLQAGELAKKEEAEPVAEEKGKAVKAKAGEPATKKAAVEAGAKKASAPKPAGGSKPKAATMRKSAQRGS
jgi:hypothetical protein